MLDITKFETIQNLLRYRQEIICIMKEIENGIGQYEEQYEELSIKLEEVNSVLQNLQNIKLTNQELINILLSILDKNNKYKLQIVNGISDYRVIYTYEQIDNANILDVSNNNWSAIILTRNNNNIVDIVDREMFENPSKCPRISTKKDFILVKFLNEKTDCERFLNEETNLIALGNLNENNGLTKEERKRLDETIINILKKKGKVKVRK